MSNEESLEERLKARTEDFEQKDPYEQEIYRKIIKILSSHFLPKVRDKEVDYQTHFVRDLSADSSDLVELMFKFEDEFKISIPDDDAEKIETIGNAVHYVIGKIGRKDSDMLSKIGPVIERCIEDIKYICKESRRLESKVGENSKWRIFDLIDKANSLVKDYKSCKERLWSLRDKVHEKKPEYLMSEVETVVEEVNSLREEQKSLMKDIKGYTLEEVYFERAIDSPTVNGSIKWCKKALKEKPDFYKARAWLGSSYVMKEKWSKAIRELGPLLSQNPDDCEVLNDLSKAYRGNGQLDKALEVSKKAVSLAPNNASYVDNLRCIYEKKKQLDKALETAKRAVSLDPGKAYYHSSLGFIYLDNHEYSKARQAAQEALRVSKNADDKDFANLLLRHIGEEQRDEQRGMF